MLSGVYGQGYGLISFILALGEQEVKLNVMVQAVKGSGNGSERAVRPWVSVGESRGSAGAKL